MATREGAVDPSENMRCWFTPADAADGALFQTSAQSFRPEPRGPSIHSDFHFHLRYDGGVGLVCVGCRVLCRGLHSTRIGPGGGFFAADLIYYLEQANEKLKKDRATKKNLHRAFLEVIKSEVGLMLGVGSLSYVCFLFSCIGWQHAAPEIFTRRATVVDVTMFVIDLSLKGALFDVIEHFHFAISRLPRADGHWLFAGYTFAFRTYVSLVMIGAVLRSIGVYTLIYKLPRHKKELQSFVRNLDGDQK